MPDPSQLAALETAALRSKDPFARLVLADALEETNPARAYAWRMVGLNVWEPAHYGEHHGGMYYWNARHSSKPAADLPLEIRKFLPQEGRIEGYVTRQHAILCVIEVLEAQFRRRSPQNRLKLPRRTSPRVWRAAK